MDFPFLRMLHNSAKRGTYRLIGSAFLLAVLLGMVCAPQALALGVTVGTVVYDTSSINSVTLLGTNLTIYGADTALDTFVVEQLPKTDITSGTQRIDYTKGDTVYFAHHLTNLGNGYDSLVVSGTTATGLPVTILQDILTIGKFDGGEVVKSTFNNVPHQPDDTGAVDSGVNILVGVFVPSNYAIDSTSIHITVKSGYMAAKGDSDLFTDYSFDTLLVIIPKITSTSGGVTSQQPSFTISIDSDAAGMPETLTVGIDPGALDGAFIDTCILVLSDTGTYDVLSGGCTVSYNGETLVIGMPMIPASDTYTAVLLSGTTVFDSNLVVSTSSIIVDTVPPIIKDTALVVNLSGTMPILTIPNVADTHSGVETFVVIVTSSTGSILFIDTVSNIASIQLPIDDAGTYTLSVTVVDLAGNSTTKTTEFEIILPLTIDVVAVNDNAIAADNVARGLTAQGCVTVEDGEANVSNSLVETVIVTLISDADVIGIPLTLTETTSSSSKFTNCFKFSNGASSAENRKIKVNDGGVVTALYDPDGTGPMAEIRDAITWQGIVITELDSVRTWPNPFIPGRGQQQQIIIQNLPSDISMSIKVYTTNMELVKVLRVGDGIDFYPNQNIGRWDGRNDRGQLIASGTYIYMVEATVAGQKIRKTSKFTVVK